MSRKVAREDCFKLIFEYQFLKLKNEITLEEFFNDNDLMEEDKDYIKRVYDGMIEHKAEILDIIQKHLSGYVISRVYKVDLAILTLAVYELNYDKQLPSAVVINEAVEIAKKYSTDKSYSFINGVLASIVKEG